MWMPLKPPLQASRSEKQSARTEEDRVVAASIPEITTLYSKLIVCCAINEFGRAMVTEFIREQLFSTPEGEKWLQ